jgi:hypothetical protein
MAEKVHVRVLGVTTSGNPDHHDGMTVREALTAAGAGDPPAHSTVTRNGRKAGMDDRVGPNDMIVVTPRVKNG